MFLKKDLGLKAQDLVETKIVNKISQRCLRTNERLIWYGEDLYVSDVTVNYLSL